MKKWAVIEEKEHDEFVKSFESKEKAIEQAEFEWSRMTKHDKKRSEITVALVNLDENDNFQEIDGGIDANRYDTAWNSKEFEEKKKLIQRTILNEKSEIIGYYYFKKDAEREVFWDDKNITNNYEKELSANIHLLNHLNDNLDYFEDGFNKIEKNNEAIYEVLEDAYFTIKRKIDFFEDLDHNIVSYEDIKKKQFTNNISQNPTNSETLKANMKALIGKTYEIDEIENVMIETFSNFNINGEYSVTAEFANHLKRAYHPEDDKVVQAGIFADDGQFIEFTAFCSIKDVDEETGYAESLTITEICDDEDLENTTIERPSVIDKLNENKEKISHHESQKKEKQNNLEL